MIRSRAVDLTCELSVMTHIPYRSGRYPAGPAPTPRTRQPLHPVPLDAAYTIRNPTSASVNPALSPARATQLRTGIIRSLSEGLPGQRRQALGKARFVPLT